MSKLTWKMMGLASVVAGSAQLATMGAASALVLPVSGQPTVGDTGPSNGKALQVEYKNKKKDRQKAQHRQYDRHRDGRRYNHRRNGYTHHYGGYWYASPWWTISAPVVVVPAPFVAVPRVVIPIPLVVIQ